MEQSLIEPPALDKAGLPISKLLKKALWVGVFALSSVLAVAARAEPRQGNPQSEPPVGQQTWFSDGWLYERTPNGWERKQYRRTFVGGSRLVYDTFLNDQPSVRMDHSKKGWVHEYHYQTKAQIR